MMNFENILSAFIIESIQQNYQKAVVASQLSFQPTRKDFEGDLTLVIFPLVKITGRSPEETGKSIGEYILKHCPAVASFNFVKGFLNIVIRDAFWIELFQQAINEKKFGFHLPAEKFEQTILVEYSSPNTNKPLHLGHVRNNLIGYSVAEILKANGKNVKKVNLVNDRGIHICKSMLAWQKYGNKETPESAGIKGDHLVGKYYVEFDKQYKKQIESMVADGTSKEEAEKTAPLILETKEMLRKWEAGDEEVLQLWRTMNSWVYDGFKVTYAMLGVDFDKFYYESETYIEGKKIVEKGLQDGLFFRKADGSVWVDLTEDGLDQKVLLRADGTSVYITQDLGTSLLRYREFEFGKLIYVVANEQDYHFKVLKAVMKKLGIAWWDSLYHLNYGMVDLPSGKMKSREGTVVDADELMTEMIHTAGEITKELGKIDGFTEQEAKNLYRIIGLGALKYFILKVDPDKRMLFNPVESIDFNGNTGPFIQYTYARIKSVLRKAGTMPELNDFMEVNIDIKYDILLKEKEVLKTILRFPEMVLEAGNRYSPAIIANYIYELVKIYNQFYHEFPIADLQNPDRSKFRLKLSAMCAKTIALGTSLLGMEMPERM